MKKRAHSNCVRHLLANSLPSFSPFCVLLLRVIGASGHQKQLLPYSSVHWLLLGPTNWWPWEGLEDRIWGEAPFFSLPASVDISLVIVSSYRIWYFGAVLVPAMWSLFFVPLPALSQHPLISSSFGPGVLLLSPGTAVQSSSGLWIQPTPSFSLSSDRYFL